MNPVTRFLGIAFVGFALAGGGPALAGDAAPDSADVIAALPPSSQDLLLPADAKPDFAAQPQSDHQSGELDFFSARPDVKSEDFTSLLGNGAGGGLKFHLNW